MIDWANARGIATELNVSRFIKSVGGSRVDERLAQPTFENADYIFDRQKVIIELKILETEFGETVSFLQKEDRIHKEMAGRFGFGQIIRMERPVHEFYAAKKLEIYRAPLARIARKANRQIRATKAALNGTEIRGILWLVNDNFRSVSVDLVFSVLCRILNGANSQIRALIYVTNHYVDVPQSDYANLLWAPAYADHSADDLPDFVDWLGSKWGDFLEAEMGPFDSRQTSDFIAPGTRPIR
jgi:hypothetical protein